MSADTHVHVFMLVQADVDLVPVFSFPLHLPPLLPPQGKVLTDGVGLHKEVCPDSMKALHERMEGLLQEYLNKYGDHGGGIGYDPVIYLGVQETPRKRLLSSSRRREKFGKSASSGGERPPTIAGIPSSELKNRSACNNQTL